VSAASEGRPEPTSCAPPVAEELSQPRAEPLGGFAQGQGSTPDWPGSQSETIGAPTFACSTPVTVIEPVTPVEGSAKLNVLSIGITSCRPPLE
jgi:hypothetical protein